MKYFRACFICGSMEAECGHRESDLVEYAQKMQDRHGTDALHATETPVAVLTTPEPLPTPLSASVEEIRRYGRELRKKRGW